MSEVRQHHKLASTGQLGQEQTINTGRPSTGETGKPSGAPPESVKSEEKSSGQKG